MIEFRFTNVWKEDHPLERSTDIATRIGADFRIVDLEFGRVLVRIDWMPVIELAYHLLKWMRADPLTRADFDFVSIDSAEIGWVWIHKNIDYQFDPSNLDIYEVTRSEWKIGSIHQIEELEYWLTLDQLHQAISLFIDEVVSRVHWQLDIDIVPLLEDDRL
ncbi:hypothetical protein JYU04_01595 [Dehalococcoides mccartyi]|nr:hypothetical protein [Dehalococcoides mccartyi]